ncbi:hypothetical protein E4634_13160 [Mangrovimicrobium sediminis]|uniref:Uncharacterized protein n=1 Tax=Mangrovimicrobium sediminis TaxID=2562682 RepID=A0A4Z0LZ88_9GAMM|nr:hypothetical protein [Haliea sp. SAOS-164]TGD72477.1 hypothetical protein E4634_13160 [Haliea sp. SAOS-164]
MGDTRTLTLHIGNHKTGTSAIQRSLFRDRQQLSEHGVTLFCTSPEGDTLSSGNASPWIGFRPAAGTRIAGVPRRDLPAALAREPGDVLMSAETFAWVFDAGQLRELYRALSAHFSRVRVIAYLRRQDQQAVSQYQQASRRDAIVAATYYGGGNRALPVYGPHLHAYLDYAQRMQLWADSFGHENLCLRLFQPDALHAGDVVQDFYRAAGLPLPGAAQRVNESTGFERTKLGHLLSEQEFEPGTRTVLARYLDDSGKLLPSRAQAQAFYDRFRQGNTVLHERYGLGSAPAAFTEDFSAYPEDAADLWNEDSANAALRHLLRGVRELPLLDSEELAAIQRAAGLLAQTDPGLARQLTAIAAEYDSRAVPEAPLSRRLHSGLRRWWRRLYR